MIPTKLPLEISRLTSLTAAVEVLSVSYTFLTFFNFRTVGTWVSDLFSH